MTGTAEETARWRRKYPERYKASYRKYKSKNREKLRLAEARFRVKYPRKTKSIRDKSRAKRYAAVRLLLNKAKSAPCIDCGNTYPPCAMDFDHVRGDKLFNLGWAASMQVPLKAIRIEMAKCEIVCSNCHRVRTYMGKAPLVASNPV